MKKRRHQIDQNHTGYSIPIRVRKNNDGETQLEINTGGTYITYGADGNAGPKIEITKDIIARISNVNDLYLHRLQSYMEVDDKNHRIRKPSIFRSTWPTQWHYLLDEEIRHYLHSVGVVIELESEFLFLNCKLGESGQFLYPDTQIDMFFDQWIDLGVHDFLIQIELRRYNRRKGKLGNYTNLEDTPSHVSGFNMGLFYAWTHLENCAIKIDSAWDRLTKYALPSYFGLGLYADRVDVQKLYKLLPEKVKENKNQETLFNKLIAIRDNYIKPSRLKSIRNQFVHQISQRPSIAIPSLSPDLSKPPTIDEFHQLVVDEHDKLREALLLFAGIIRSKTPENQFIN